MKRTRRYAMAGVSVMAALVLAACSGGEAGTGTPDEAGSPVDETSEQSAPPADDSGEGESDSLVPSVADPKNIEGADPCSWLTPDVAGTLGFESEGEQSEADASGAACRWESAEGARITLTGDWGREGLDEIFSRQDQFADWEPMEIAGFPAVRANQAAEPTASCGVAVGIADTQYLDFIYFRAGSEDPCDMVLEAAAAVIPTLPDAE